MPAKKQIKLPGKPSALIRLAVRDLEKVERSRRYKVDMSVYHKPNGVCRVCFAGAVLAYSLKVPRDFDSFNNQMPEADKMRALDYFRSGAVGYGCDRMGIHTRRNVPHYINVAEYADDPKAFKRDMRKLATLLAKRGC